MPFKKIDQTDLSYGLISFDAKGRERTDDADGLMSRELLKVVSENPITNVFFFSHGWRGERPAAIQQYDRWIRAFMERSADIAEAKQKVAKFQPFFIGLHWPSEPWGKEDLGGADSFGAAGATSAAEIVDMYLQRLGDSTEIRRCLEVLVDEARQNAAPDTLPERARDAYNKLNEALGLKSDGTAAAPPDADRVSFDADEAFDATNEEAGSFGGFSLGGVLGPLKLLSYWTMKKRARSIGEGGMHQFLKDLQQQTAIKRTRIHLMGHSFGCIVVSSMLGGPEAAASLERPVDSVALVQGAVSLWSYCPRISFSENRPGYYHRVLKDGKVSGPLVTTRSRHDSAVGTMYPLASRLRGSADFAPQSFPEFGAIGSFGLQGLTDKIQLDLPMASAEQAYPEVFARGRVINLEASDYIAKKEGVSGAHSDIAGPEVAHALWTTALASLRDNVL